MKRLSLLLVFLWLAPIFAIVFCIAWKPRPHQLKLKLDVTRILKELNLQVKKRWPQGFDANTFIDVPVFYINLEKSVARRKHMTDAFAALDLSPAPLRIDAVLGTTYLAQPWTESWVHPSLHSHYQGLVERKEVTPAELGCLLSHIKAIRQAHHANVAEVLILEDDVDFSSVGLWTDSLRSLTRRAPFDWNFIQLWRVLDSCLESMGNGLYKQKNGDHCYGAVAYLISKQAIDKLHDLFFVDGFLAEKHYFFGKLKNLRFTSDDMLFHCLEPYNVYFEELSRFCPNNTTDELESTIHSDHTPGHIQRTIEVFKGYLRT